ncbi:MAG: DUF5615 family PIN-like protein [Candidatus Woesearchaeota archaeon]
MSSSNDFKIISDENIPIKLTELLKEKGFDILRALLNSSDKRIFKIAKEESRIILVFDKHFINRRLFPPAEHYGIILIQIHPPLIDTVLLSLLNLFEKVEPLEFKGKLFILSQFGYRIKT